MNNGFADRRLTTWLCRQKLERETGFEPATSTLARLHSTAELFPLDLHYQELLLQDSKRLVKSLKESLPFAHGTALASRSTSLSEDDRFEKSSEVIDARKDGQEHGHPKEGHAQVIETDGEVVSVKYEEGDGSDLKKGLVFP